MSSMRHIQTLGIVGTLLVAGCAARVPAPETVREPARASTHDGEQVWLSFQVANVPASELAKTLNELVSASRAAVAERRGCVLFPPATQTAQPSRGTSFSGDDEFHLLNMFADVEDASVIQGVKVLLVRLGAITPDAEPSRWTKLPKWDPARVRELARDTAPRISSCSCCVELVDLSWPRAELYAAYLNELVRLHGEVRDRREWSIMTGLFTWESVDADSVFAASDEYTVVILAGATEGSFVDAARSRVQILDALETRRQRFPKGSCILPAQLEVMTVSGDGGT